MEPQKVAYAAHLRGAGQKMLPSDNSNTDNPSLFGLARQIIARLRQASDTVETASRQIAPRGDRVGGLNAQQSEDPTMPSLQLLLEEANQLAHMLANDANDLAAKIGQ